MSLQINEKNYETDVEGYLVNIDDWTREFAEEMAKQDGCCLTDSHWEIMNLLRDYYAQYQISPAVRVLVKSVGKKLGKEKGNSKYIYQLFPDGPARQACRYAGLQKPTGCV